MFGQNTRYDFISCNFDYIHVYYLCIKWVCKNHRGYFGSL